VVAYFSSPPDPWRVLSGPTNSGTTVQLVLTDGSSEATVSVSPAAETAGEGISRIVIDYAG
jgi:hypothetical protein